MAENIYVSPHLDDAVLSCGGLIYQQSAEGASVGVLTVFAGDPPKGPLSAFARSLHQRWGIVETSVEQRREEDRAACDRLGAEVHHLPLPEAIYRKEDEREWLYPSEESIFGTIAEKDKALQQEIGQLIYERVNAAKRVYCPIGLGGHVDHVLTRIALERLGIGVHYYQDFPYTARGGEVPRGFSIQGEETLISLTDGEIHAWILAVTDYHSQLTTFWDDAAEMKLDLQKYYAKSGGLLVRYRSAKA